MPIQPVGLLGRQRPPDLRQPRPQRVGVLKGPGKFFKQAVLLFARDSMKRIQRLTGSTDRRLIEPEQLRQSTIRINLQLTANCTPEEI